MITRSLSGSVDVLKREDKEWASGTASDDGWENVADMS